MGILKKFRHTREASPATNNPDHHLTVVIAGTNKDPQIAYKPLHETIEKRGDVFYVPPRTIYEQADGRFIDDVTARLRGKEVLTVMADSAGGLQAYNLAVATSPTIATRLMLLDSMTSADQVISPEFRADLKTLVQNPWLARFAVKRYKKAVKFPGPLRSSPHTPEEQKWFEADKQAMEQFPDALLGRQLLTMGRFLPEGKLTPDTPVAHLQSRHDGVIGQKASSAALKELIPHINEIPVPRSFMHAGITTYPKAWQAAVEAGFNHLDQTNNSAN